MTNHQDRFQDELLDFLSIPSISSLPQNAADVQRAGAWVAQHLRDAGMEHVEIMATGHHPVVYADWLHAPGKPTVMIYGHFDTQPVDPLDLWDSPPFQPVIKDGRVYARGASDDKGNMLAPVLALEALLKADGSLPINVKCFFEGQEEIGSPTLPAFIAEHKDKFACDFVISADGGQWQEDQPALAIGFKGLCAIQIDVTGPAYDVHSGAYGGAIQNPIHALVRLLDSMRSPEGRILVQGFYDAVRSLTDADRAQIAAVPFDEADYKAKLGIDEVFGEPGYTTLERAWTRPTLELNGIWGGFQDAGVKTVLPSQAHAKITCRLVPDQKPDAIVDLLRRHIATHTPPGVTDRGERARKRRRPLSDAGRASWQSGGGRCTPGTLRQRAFLRAFRRQHPGVRHVSEIVGRLYRQLWFWSQRRTDSLTERVLPPGKLSARSAGVLHAPAAAGARLKPLGLTC